MRCERWTPGACCMVFIDANGDTHINNAKSVLSSFDFVVYPGADTSVNYYSEDEMVKGRRAGGTNKKGHPIYSREDIREQYCINKKELGVFENGYFQENRLFGCLSTSHLPDKSPCAKSKSLLSCVAKRKSSTESSDDLSQKISVLKLVDSKKVVANKNVNDQDDDDSDGGFKRRIKPKAASDKKWTIPTASKAVTTTSNANQNAQQSISRPAYVPHVPTFKAPLPSTVYSSGQTTSRPSEVHQRQPKQQHKPQNILTPSASAFDPSRDGPPFAAVCRSNDELNGKYSWYSNKPLVSSITGQPLIADDGIEKHVTFESNYIVRSNTVGADLANDAQVYNQTPYLSDQERRTSSSLLSAAAVSDSVKCTSRISPCHPSSRSHHLPKHHHHHHHHHTRNHSQERLIVAVVKGGEAMTMTSVKSLDLAAIQSSSSVYTSISGTNLPAASIGSYGSYPYTSPSTTYVPAYRVVKRAIMKTQATQTEHGKTAGRHSRTIPAYLTLSPRASGHLQPKRVAKASAHHFHRRTTSATASNGDASGAGSSSRSSKSRHIYTDESEDEVMEIQVKEQRLKKHTRSVSRGKDKMAQDSGERSIVHTRARNGSARASRVVSGPIEVTTEEVVKTVLVSSKSESQIKRFLKSHSVDEIEEIDKGPTGQDIVFSRRHSVAEDFSLDPNAMVLYPPPGFGESTDELKKFSKGDSPGRSSTDSSKAIYSGLTDVDQQSITEVEELDSSIHSHESPTLVSDPSRTLSLSGAAGGQPDLESLFSVVESSRRETTKVTCRPLIVDPSRTTTITTTVYQRSIRSGGHPSELTSPESETSSHFTEAISSKSEVTSSSSGRYEMNVEEKQSGSGSSVYATATDHSPRDERLGSGRPDDQTQTSFETASSAAASQFSSPSSSGKRKSSSEIEEPLVSPDNAIDTHGSRSSLSLLSPVISPGLVPRSPKKQQGRFFFEEPRSESSEDSSTAKREKAGSPGSLSTGSKSMEQLEEFDSEGIGELTPIHELCSSDPSTAFEPLTVIENVSRFHRSSSCSKEEIQERIDEVAKEVTPKVDSPPKEEAITIVGMEEEVPPTLRPSESDIQPEVELSSTVSQTEATDSGEEEGEAEPVESDDLDVFITDEKEYFLAGTSLFCRRTLSGELSTVSEVSEEISNQKSDFSSSLSSLEKQDNGSPPAAGAGQADDGTPEQMDKAVGESDGKGLGERSPSLSGSTTSGSFIIDCHSEIQGTPDDRKLQPEGSFKKTESLPCLKSSEVVFREADQVTTTMTSESLEKTPSPGKVGENNKYVAGQVDTAGESSQATERDVARSEFSLEQQSSQEIDEESLSMGQFASLEPGLKREGSEDTSSTTTTSTNQQWRWKQPPGLPPLHPRHPLRKLNLVSEDELDGQRKKPILETKESKEESFEDELKSKDEVAAGPCDKESSSESSVKPPGSQASEEQVSEDKTVTLASDESNQKDHPCSHQFTCSHCGEASGHTSGGGSTTTSSGKRSSLTKAGIPIPYARASATLEEMKANKQDSDEQDHGVHSEPYRCVAWYYIGKRDEYLVWGHRLLPEGSSASGYKFRLDIEELTEGERIFRKQYEAVTHRMIHRKASIEMYKKILEKSFAVEKKVNVLRNNGEFGFRIHGSRPVVVSAIERGTPAEVCGLEIGDIVVSVNDVNVLDAAHSEVVRIAHSGSECLKLELVPTCHILKSEDHAVEGKAVIISGYLSRKTVIPSMSTSAESSGHEDVLWKKRWYSLKMDYCLQWFLSSKETDILGALSLHCCCASVVPTGKTGEPSNFFKLSKCDEVPLYFQALDHQSAINWVAALNAASNKLSLVDPYMEISLKNTHLKPEYISNCDCSGFLEKFNQRYKTWNQRYFVLKDACLYFYFDPQNTTALGIFYLHGYKVQSCNMVSARHTFELIPPETRFRHLWLKADSELDKKRWLAALEYSIDRWLKLSR